MRHSISSSAKRSTAFLAVAACVGALSFVGGATAAVNQTRDSVHHEIKTVHDLNICGNPGTFTFDVTNFTHTVDNGTTFVFEIHEVTKYTLVFDDPTLGTWTAHSAETIHFVANHSGDIFMQNFNSKEGPVQITEHEQLRVDSEGNITTDRTFDRHVGC
jgi:hypothetical protein